ncbi:MAG: LPS-assembly protein LptD [Chakrabartia sp.]
MNLLKRLFLSAALISAITTSPARAQDVSDPAAPASPSAPSADAAQDPKDPIDFAADSLEYDETADMVIARGDVRMARDGNHVRADEIQWNRTTGEVRAKGDVIVESAQGDRAYGDDIELKDTLRDGIVSNLLIVLNDGGRLVAERAVRTNGISTLDRAVYSPCRVLDREGCPKKPLWQITAVRVTHNPERNRISYKNARLELLGIPILALPGLSHPADDRGGTGFLIPNLQYTKNTGLEVATPFYLLIGPNKDMTITPHVYSDVDPMLEASYRHLTDFGAYQVTAYGTRGKRISANDPSLPEVTSFRGYIEANGRFQFSRHWSLSPSLRLASDRTFLRRYDISRDDRLRTVVDLERISQSSYLSIAGWSFQTLRPAEIQGQMPIALPVIDWRKRLADPVMGGNIQLQLNSLALVRTAGQDTQRAFAGVRWDVSRFTPLGQEVRLTAYGRADAYHSDQNALTQTEAYRGEAGWNGRAIGAVAAEVRWPLIGDLMGGVQQLTPRFQIVGTPSTANLKIPNEDARAVDLEDSNLFALNRFAGYDRWEDASRITYGADWGWDGPGLRINATIGQSYRIAKSSSAFPNGTGLYGRTSDIVGRTEVRFRRLVSVTHRYRLDKDSLAIRRNEIGATLGNSKTYASVDYLRLNRNIGPELEDLRDREEVRLGGRVQLARYWSVFGSTTIDLTGKQEDPTSSADGYEPVRHRLGITYEDDCFVFGLTWRRDYETQGDVRRGNTFQLRLSFRNLGR